MATRGGGRRSDRAGAVDTGRGGCQGNSTRARIVLFRKPIERRVKGSDELADLLHEILVAQVATYLGVEPSVIDPTIDDD